MKLFQQCTPSKNVRWHVGIITGKKIKSHGCESENQSVGNGSSFAVGIVKWHPLKSNVCNWVSNMGNAASHVWDILCWIEQYVSHVGNSITDVWFLTGVILRFRLRKSEPIPTMGIFTFTPVSFFSILFFSLTFRQQEAVQQVEGII